MFGKNKKEKLFKELENADKLSAQKINKIYAKIFAVAQKGDGEAYYKLYEFARDNYKNRRADIKYYDWLGALKKAAALEYPKAVCEYYGRHGLEDVPKRIAMLERAAAKGSDEACILLAKIYDRAFHGYSKDGLEKLTKQDCAKKSIEWLTVAAERSNTDAQIMLGNFLSLYQGDLDGGEKWLAQAAEKDNAEAYLGLARVYKKKEELYKAQKYYKFAADKGNNYALGGLGEVLLLPGMYQNIDKGLKILEESANKGNMVAATRLADIYEKGEIIPKDLEKSKFWKDKVKEIQNNFVKRNEEIEAKAAKDLSGD
ncbi:MAG: hypothetical protein K2H30_00905 [Clostridia bacterium]|nr:hypothetical protein [Clostridia bacterium]